jgi:hypothetical protein
MNVKNARICARHFSNDQYDPIALRKFKMLGHTLPTAKLLLPSAIPDQNLPVSTLQRAAACSMNFTNSELVFTDLFHHVY